MNSKITKLIAIGLMMVLILFSFWGMLKKDNSEEFEEDPVKQNEHNDSNEKPFEPNDENEEVKEEDADSEEDKYELKDNSEGSSEFIREEEDLLILNNKKFGEENINKALTISEDAAAMWLEEVEDYKTWKKISTKDFYKYTKENIIDKHEERKIEVSKVKSYPLYDKRENVMVVETIVDYSYEEDSSIEKKMILITFEMVEKEFLISSLAVM